MRSKSIFSAVLAAGLLSGCAGVQRQSESAMEQRAINPWKWQDQFGFVQATEVKGAQSTLYLAGQPSVGPDGNVLHAGDMKAQVNQCLDNIETVLKASGFGMQNIVRLNFYTTNVDLFLANHDLIVERVTKAGARFGSTLLGVTRLASPDMLIEMEATAVK